MKFNRIMFGLALALVTMFSAGCNEPTYIVYVDDNPCSIKTWDGDIIENLWVFPKDRVIWVNTTANDLTVTFGAGTSVSVFSVTSIDIPMNGRVMLTVKSDASGSLDYDISPCISGLPGSPKVIVGDPP